MRNLINLVNPVLTEEKLSAAQMPATKFSTIMDPKTGKKYTRQQLFLVKVQTGSPFTLVTGGEVTIDPKEAPNVKRWLLGGMARPLVMQTVDGNSVKNTDLQKTVEFGSKEAETIAIKGSDIFATTDQEISDFGNSVKAIMAAGGFPAKDMYNKIVNSSGIKQVGAVGKAVTLIAKQIVDGASPVIPKGLKAQELKAIELYASEYLGVMSVVYRGAKFVNGSREQFDEFVGTNIGDMIMYFPKSTSNPLADSFSVVNNKTGHAIKISSKAAGKGAPPSLSSLKIPDEVKKRYPIASEFHAEATKDSYSAFEQPFRMLNWLFINATKHVPKSYYGMLPFKDEMIGILQNNFKDESVKIPASVRNVFYKRLSSQIQNNSASIGGKAFYAVTKDVMAIVNSGGVEGFREALIESLGYNFIQLYSNIKGNNLVTEAFWPAKISGQVKLKTKSSAGEVKGRISVEISPSRSKVAGPEADHPIPKLADIGNPATTPIPQRPKRTTTENPPRQRRRQI
jgi:hypothetical protein